MDANSLKYSKNSLYIVVDSKDSVCEVLGDTNGLLQIPLGRVTTDLSKLANPEIYDRIRIALDCCKYTNEESVTPVFIQNSGTDSLYCQVRVFPYNPNTPEPNRKYFIQILKFQKSDFLEIYEFQNSDTYSEEARMEIQLLREKLALSKESLTTYIQILEESNEKLKKMNEELQLATTRYQSLNEELETSNEELRVSNEELQNAYAEVSALNNQLRFREEEIKRKEETLRAMVDSVPGVIFSAMFPDPESFHFIYLSPKIETDFGISLNLAYESGHTALPIHPEDLKSWKEALRNSFHTGEPFLFKGRFLYADGKIQYFECRSSVNRISSTHVVCDGFLMNTTKQIEQDIQTEKIRNEFRETVRSTIGVIFKFKRLETGEYRYILNEGFIGENLGITTNTVAGRLLSEVIGKEEALKLQKEYDKAFTDGEIMTEISFRDRWYFLRILPYFENGTKEGIIGSAIDITEKKLLENRLLQSQKMETIGYLAAGIAHDLKNMLQPAFIYLKLLNEKLEKAETLEISEKIFASVLRARSLVSQILDFSRNPSIDERKKEPLLLRQSLIENLNFLLIDKPSHIQVVTDFRLDSDKRIFIDPAKFTQVLMNLINNAMYVMKNLSEGKLTVSAYSVKEIPADWISELIPSSKEGHILTIEDTGIGISNEKLQHIFKPFYTDKHSGEGIGLGLSIVYGIMEKIGGSIAVDSVVNKGTRFRLFFPDYKFEGNENLSSLASPETFTPFHEKNPSIRILLIEDDEFTKESVEDFLSVKGFHCRSFRDPAEGFDYFCSAAEPFNLILTDYKMPGMTGIDFVKMVRKKDPHIPIIMYSGNLLSIDRDFVKEHQIILLEKPIDTDVLTENIWKCAKKE